MDRSSTGSPQSPKQSSIMNGSRTRMSLRDFVSSDQLSKGNLRFNVEAEGDKLQPPRPSGGGPETNETNGEKLLHAAKLALQLAETFANLEQGNDIEPESLRLDNFFVRFQLEGASESKGDESCSSPSGVPKMEVDQCSKNGHAVPDTELEGASNSKGDESDSSQSGVPKKEVDQCSKNGHAVPDTELEGASESKGDESYSSQPGVPKKEASPGKGGQDDLDGDLSEFLSEWINDPSDQYSKNGHAVPDTELEGASKSKGDESSSSPSGVPKMEVDRCSKNGHAVPDTELEGASKSKGDESDSSQSGVPKKEVIQCSKIGHAVPDTELEGASNSKGDESDSSQSGVPKKEAAQGKEGEDDLDDDFHPCSKDDHAVPDTELLSVDAPGGEGIESGNLKRGKQAWCMNILYIDFQPPLNGESLHGDAVLGKKNSFIQTLGNHIHAIFSGNTQETLSRFIPEEKEKAQEYSSQQSSRRRTFKGNALFSTLLEMGNYPVSVCRLVSDMIDPGNGDEGGRPYASLGEVIQDLEQMSNHPHVFLHDQGIDFYSSGLHFGQRCYGRVEELTRFLDISTTLEQGTSSHGASEAVFVSGVAGSGKSHFVRNVGGFLTKLGWTVFKEKFKREMEHGSREIVSSLFEKLVTDIAGMEGSDEDADVDKRQPVAQAIAEELDFAHLSSLANFIPSIKELFPKIDESASAESDMSLWRLVFLLSKLLKAVLGLGRRILVCLDDLQWCDTTMLTLIKEIVISIGKDDRGRRQFLFVAMYRHDEIPKSHPLVDHLALLQKSCDVNVTEIELSSLSADGVADMVMSEMRLPRRLISSLSRVVHKKTSGHAIFVVQFLNSLVRESTIAYSPRKHRFDWDENKIAALRMGDSVASLIASNLSSLRDEALQSLRILSCFGMQIPLSLIKLLSKSPRVPKGGIEYFLPSLIDRGVVEMSGLFVFFTHDLIQQHVYENIPVKERRLLNLDLGTFVASEIGLDSLLVVQSVQGGALFVASEIALDSSLVVQSVQGGVEELTLEESNVDEAAKSDPSYSLIAIATNQINFAGPGSVSDRPGEQIRFARWNIRAGKDAADRWNFQAALYYYKHGVAFLGDGLWRRDCHRLCHELHEGLALSFFAVGDHSSALKQANAVIGNVAFEDSLESQRIRIRSLDSFGRYAEAVASGLDLLRQLGMDIPLEATPSAVARAMSETARAASAHSFAQMTSTCSVVDAKKRSVMKCANALMTSFFRSASPYLPLLGCAVINYSLQNGICQESAAGFFIFGYSKISLENKYEEGRYWGNAVLKLLEGATSNDILVVGPVCNMFLHIFFYPFKELSFHQFKMYQRFTAIGNLEFGLYALRFSITLSFYAGERLSLILNSAEKLISSMMKVSPEGTKLATMQKLLIDEVVGDSKVFPDFGGIVHDEHSLLIEAQIKKNIVLIEAIHEKRFSTAFWMGDYIEARKCSKAILALPSSKMLKISRLFHTFFMGLIAFKAYRDGEGEEHLDEGKKALDKMEVWSSCSTANFINKLLLLEAEHHASMCNMYAAKAAYEASVRAARDHGLVHEQGLACELYGKFLLSVMETDEALRWLKFAHECYTQWGAIAKAEQVFKEHNLGLLQPEGDSGQFVNKHGREW